MLSEGRSFKDVCTESRPEAALRLSGAILRDVRAHSMN